MKQDGNRKDAGKTVSATTGGAKGATAVVLWTRAAMLVAIAVLLSGFHFPIGFAKVFPVQHLINVVGGVVLGPVPNLCAALVTSTIRVMLGTGTLLAFPGSVFGALLAGLLYQKSRKLLWAVVGEAFGTGVIGALAAYPVAALLMGRDVAVYTFLLPFCISSLIGAMLGATGLKVLMRTNVIKTNGNKTKENV